MGKTSLINTLILVGILVLGAGTLGVAIAILVNTSNNNNNNNTPGITTVPPPPIPTSSAPIGSTVLPPATTGSNTNTPGSSSTPIGSTVVPPKTTAPNTNSPGLSSASTASTAPSKTTASNTNLPGFSSTPIASTVPPKTTASNTNAPGSSSGPTASTLAPPKTTAQNTNPPGSSSIPIASTAATIPNPSSVSTVVPPATTTVSNTATSAPPNPSASTSAPPNPAGSSTPAPVYVDPAKVLNIPKPAQISTNDARYKAYQQVVQLFQNSLNLTANPCDDFYAYTCSNLKGDMSFDVSDMSNAVDMVTQLTNDNYIKTASLPVQQTRWYFDQCVQARQNWNQLVADGKQVTNAINQLQAGEASFPNDTQYPFPMLDQNTDVTTFPTRIGLGYLVGALAAQGVSTLVSPGVDTNWKDPYGPDGFAYLIDQPTTFYPNTYYLKNWDATKATLTSTIKQTMMTLAQVQNKVLNPTILEKDVADVVQLDYLLATVFSTDDTTRRQYERSYNPNTMTQLTTLFNGNIFSWHTFIPLATGAAEDAVYKLLATAYNYFVVLEKDKLNLLLSSLVSNNTYNITPRQLVNYLYYRLVDSQSEFLPSSGDSKTVLPITKIVRGPGRPKHEMPEERKYSRKQMADISDAQISCAFETVDQIQYANARIFIDRVYPTPDSRTAVREHVAKVASSIVVGFRSMIDQLDWMTTSTKKGAYNKIENLVKNIAYPDWITDDNQLTAYHSEMTFKQTDDYFTVLASASQFNMYAQWIQLVQGAADRTGFNGPPGVTNAWYQPELNSITFPAGILKQPFYDFNWPASVNFGAMGVIAGHELTHGFDDQGVQWNGIGTLSGWMDSQSNKDFTKMAQCVINEYNGFCPLDKAKYGKSACVDGAQTQGENIADNGGIHSAFRAYKNYVDLYGPDGTLPDDSLQYFNPDQLFFLSFARIWCQLPDTEARTLRQLLVDVHSPSVYRVWGTIQNFPAFKSAFNCPASNYAPDNHCNVWVSDIDTTFGVSNVKTDLNIVPEAPITSRDVPKMDSYQMAVNYYSQSVDTTVDPCDDFFKYACGSFNQPVSFTTARNRNYVLMSDKLQDPAYQATIQNVSALTKEKQFFDACVLATNTSQSEDQLLIQKNYIGNKVANLKNLLGQDFTLVNGGKANLPNNTQLGNALGYLSFSESIDTFVSPLVDTYWPDNTKGYQMFIDQNTCFLSKTYYQANAWKIEQPSYNALVVDVVQRYAREENITLPDNYVDLIGKVLSYEQTIAVKYSTDDDTRRNFARSWNPTPVGSLNGVYPFLDWNAYMAQSPAIARKIVSDPSYNVSIMETDRLAHFSADYSFQDPTLLVNYLYIRLLLGNAQYIPSYASAFANMPEESIMIGLSRRKSVETVKFPLSGADAAQNGPACASAANNLMQFANGRVFVDVMYPKDTDVQNIRASAGGVIANVITAFQGMIDQLDWMSADDKKLAYDKTVNIKQNIAFPDWIRDNAKLSDYYSALTIDNNDNYYDIMDKLIKFNLYLQYNQLNAQSTDRSDFLGQPGTVNAWYQPELNSITFPAGILVPPYFHPQWPPSINYGGMGLVAGHELTHGFDDQGVQWGPTGNLDTWMKDSTAGFQNMAACVINEYDNFCPLNATLYSPNCVKGTQTQGENIADNGGIHAAFNAYKSHQALDGPDARLPDRLFGQFTHDQLFFLNFAQVWCETRRSDAALYKQIMVDPHSPSMYRVFGTIQNFPAFQTAYNCPLGSKSAPKDHCEVWVPTKYQ